LILITGAMGFVGLQVARELAATDEVVLGYNRSVVPDEELRATIPGKYRTARVDVSSPYALLGVVAEHGVDSIVHLAVPALGAMPAAEETLTNVSGLVNVLEAARIAGVRRVSIASSVAVYSGLASGPFREETPLPTSSVSATSAMKKAEEILALHYADRTGLDLAMLRIGVVYGPRYRTLANLAGRLTYQAVKGEPADSSAPWASTNPWALDLVHVNDCAKGIALIHAAPELQNRVYNVGAGTSISPADVAAAVTAAVPGFQAPAELNTAESSSSPETYMDISRLRGELGFEPAFDLTGGIADYASWLATHDR
jgi:nucleoside-diphosphate-sugar epimerase